MTVNVQQLFDRIAVIETAALSALSSPISSDAKSYFWHVQETMPYWTNRLGTIEVDADGDEYEIHTYEVIARLIIGHKSDLERGLHERELQRIVPQFIAYLNARELLQSSTYATGMDSLTNAQVISCRGYTEFQNSGSGAEAVGTEFTIRAIFEEEITQAYL